MEAANKRIQEDYPHAYFSSYSYNSFSSTDETGKTTTEVSGQAKCVAKPPTGKEVEVEVDSFNHKESEDEDSKGQPEYELRVKVRDDESKDPKVARMKVQNGQRYTSFPEGMDGETFLKGFDEALGATSKDRGPLTFMRHALADAVPESELREMFQGNKAIEG